MPCAVCSRRAKIYLILLFIYLLLFCVYFFMFISKSITWVLPNLTPQNKDKYPQSPLPTEHSSQKFQHITYLSLSLITYQQKGYSFIKNKGINFNRLKFYKLLIFIKLTYLFTSFLMKRKIKGVVTFCPYKLQRLGIFLHELPIMTLDPIKLPSYDIFLPFRQSNELNLMVNDHVTCMCYLNFFFFISFLSSLQNNKMTLIPS
jgi:hypothetical protein